jgi:DNA-binding PadR family transcriptional regulator
MPPKRLRDEKPSPLAAQTVGVRAAEDPRPSGVWLVLALVIEQPSHGYELSQRYERRFGSFQSMSVPRVYAALDRLRDGGMIEPITLKPVKPARRQHQMRRTYQATDVGVQEYRRWVAEQMRDDPRRPALLARLASVGVLGIDAVLDVIDCYQRECMEELRVLPTASQPLEGGGLSLEELTESLVIDQQRRELRARNDWAAHARQILEAHKRRLSAESGERAAGKS